MKRKTVAVVDEAACIGCARCIDACPVDAIVGAQGYMHTVVESWCIGCELCLPPCPVDCIAPLPVTGTRTGWQAWSAPQASAARERYDRHLQRQQRDGLTHEESRPAPDKRSVVAAALARARQDRIA